MKLSDLAYKTAWLGNTPTDKRIECQFDSYGSDEKLAFTVLNGGWNGLIYEKDDGWAISVCATGDEYLGIHLVELVNVDRPLTYDEDVGICF